MIYGMDELYQQCQKYRQSISGIGNIDTNTIGYILSDTLISNMILAIRINIDLYLKPSYE